MQVGPEGKMTQLMLLPIDPEFEPASGLRPVPIGGRRRRRSPRVAVGAPGYLSVRAAAERLE